MTSIQEKWRDRSCPLFDGVTYRDGTIVLMECSVFLGDDEEVGQVHLRPLARSTLDSFVDYNPEGWVHVGGPAPVVDGARGLELTFGEGSMGGDGFVAVSDAGGELRWVAFFQGSNPFERAWLEEDVVVAMSTHGHTWRFPLDCPERAQVLCG
ncbi:hypothetical protein [Sorangium sp. So ce1151]|uniref:hypothetical protein n=1 Tax=Sorangium sp. So ce1151 TaxID=3133332 RepID=UPI003F5E271D